jgi:hypothetical protein
VKALEAVIRAANEGWDHCHAIVTLPLHCCYSTGCDSCDNCESCDTCRCCDSYWSPSGQPTKGLDHCCYIVVTLLLHCCYTVVTLLLHCCHTVVTLLVHCCCTVVTLLLHATRASNEGLAHRCTVITVVFVIVVTVMIAVIVVMVRGRHPGSQRGVGPLSHCCYTFVTLLLHFCYIVITLLLYCCYTVVNVQVSIQ